MAPARSAPATSCSFSETVSMAMRVAGAAAWMRRAASMPPPGMEMSRRARSGAWRSTSATASSALAALPTTVKTPRSSSVRTRPSRKMG